MAKLGAPQKDGAEVTAHPRPAFQPRKVPVAGPAQHSGAPLQGQHHGGWPVHWTEWCREDMRKRIDDTMKFLHWAHVYEGSP